MDSSSLHSYKHTERITERLRELALASHRLGLAMNYQGGYCEDNPEMVLHGLELLGASKLMQQWLEEMATKAAKDAN